VKSRRSADGVCWADDATRGAPTHFDHPLKCGGLSRRQVMRMFAASAVLIGCGDDGASTESGTTTGSGGSGPGPGGVGGAGGGMGSTGGAGGTSGVGGQGGSGGDPLALCHRRGPTAGCYITEDNILGPFYKANAPFDGNLADDLAGELMLIEGTVYGCDCETPLAGAVVDVWQADSEGAYDSAGFTLRGRIETDADGRYSLLTIKPGWYLNGNQFRPAHIHYKVSHQDGAALTTQLYFEGDPYIPDDPFVKDSLVIPLSTGQVRGSTALIGTFDVVLA
jgi:catechol 1,2-dioxygenase